jgi:hypothetical protein
MPREDEWKGTDQPLRKRKDRQKGRDEKADDADDDDEKRKGSFRSAMPSPLILFHRDAITVSYRRPP